MKYDFTKIKSLARYIDNQKRRDDYINALNQFEAALKGEADLYKARFSEMYTYAVVRRLEEIHSKLRHEILPILRDNNFSEDEPGRFATNSIKKLHKHWSKYKTKYPNMYDFYDSILQLPDIVKDLKPLLKAGKAPAPVDPKKFVKPMIPREALKIASDFLQDSVEQIRQEYYKQMTSHLMKLKEEIAKQTPLDSSKVREMSPEKRFIAPHILKTEYIQGKNVSTLKPDADKVIEGLAKQQVDTIIMDFVAKNSSKLGHIFAKKSEVTEHKIIHNRIKHANLENIMYFKFNDGSSFKIYTTTVYGYSKLGTFYVSFPTRFTDVVMKDGSKMSMPSEEKMIKEF